MQKNPRGRSRACHVIWAVLWILPQIRRILRLLTANWYLARRGPTTVILGSRKHAEDSLAYRFCCELSFWLGLCGIGQRTGGGGGAMAAGNRGAMVARELIDKIARNLAQQKKLPPPDEVLAMIEASGSWQHTRTILRLAGRGRLPDPAAAITSQIESGDRPASIGVNTTFLTREKSEPPNEWIAPGAVLMQETFDDRHDVLLASPEWGDHPGTEAAILVPGRMGTKHEFFELLNRVKHGLLPKRRSGRPLPPIYLADPDGDNHPESKFWEEMLRHLSTRYVTPADLHCVRLVDYSMLPYVLEEILYHVAQRRGGYHHLCGANPQPMPEPALCMQRPPARHVVIDRDGDIVDLQPQPHDCGCHQQS